MLNLFADCASSENPTMGLFSSLASDNVLLITAILMIFTAFAMTRTKQIKNGPPMVKYSIPFLGSAIPYGIDPVAFLLKCKEEYGDCFTFLMMGRRMTFCIAPDGNHFVFNIPLASASAEGAYETLTVPVFGSEVVYDVDNALFMEQKKFIKDALTVNAFKSYVGFIMDEAKDFLISLPAKGQIDMFESMSELTIRTASRCLLGKEIRSQLHSNVASLYHDLDAGFAPINVFFRWLPLPAYFARDRANQKMTDLFKSIIIRRRNATTENSTHTDVLATLVNAKYKDGSEPSDDAKAHILIALLMGGQHTSSTTLSWIVYELTRTPDVVKEIIKEQSLILTGSPDCPAKDLPDFDYDQLKKFEFLDCVMKETLRLHPPIHTIMRKVEKEVTFKGFDIPKGDFLCGSQAVSQRDPVRFPDPQKFDPSRFLNNTEGSGEWSIQAANIAQKSARSHFLPFGAGRHRCIGEAFAFVQIKTIISQIIRLYEFDLVKKDHFPQPDYSSLVVVPERGTLVEINRR